jgi:hypothetical protein
MKEKNGKSISVWKVIFIILIIIVDIIFVFHIFRSGGAGYELLRIIFFLLPMADFLLLMGYYSRTNSGKSNRLSKVGFILLLIINVLFGYIFYQAFYQSPESVGLGSLAIIPFFFILGINDIAALLLL